jgi:hypothetical protein
MERIELTQLTRQRIERHNRIAAEAKAKIDEAQANVIDILATVIEMVGGDVKAPYQLTEDGTALVLVPAGGVDGMAK